MKAEELINIRNRRADAVLRIILQEAHMAFQDVMDTGADIQDVLERRLSDRLRECGAEIVTDVTREAMGLPGRGPNGWTVDEMLELERRRLRSLYGYVEPQRWFAVDAAVPGSDMLVFPPLNRVHEWSIHRGFHHGLRMDGAAVASLRNTKSGEALALSRITTSFV